MTLKTGTIETSLCPPARLLKVFRHHQALTDQPAQLTILKEVEQNGPNQQGANKMEDDDAEWEDLGRPHTSSVRFFETILPPQLPHGEPLPNHLFKAAVWHAIWNHANLNENPSLSRLAQSYCFEPSKSIYFISCIPFIEGFLRNMS